jgi:hypothetical protein
MADPLVQSIATAIARQENANPLSNNPGNLKPIPGGWTGQTGVDSFGIATFDNPQDGWNALYAQVQTNINRGLDLNQFFAGGPGYSGYASAAAGNNPAVYAANVSAWTGIDPNVPLNLLQSSGAATAGIPGASTQPAIDLFGSSATAPTSDILAQLESTVGPIDLTNPWTDVALLAGLGAAVWLATT